jgi:hypothetical protein
MNYTTNDLRVALLAAYSGAELLRIGDFSDKATWEVKYPDDATDAQKAAAQAVIDAAPIPIIVAHKSLTPEEFAARFTEAESDALYGSTDTVVIKFLRRINRFQVIYIDNDETIAAMNYLVSLGILTETRATEILK